MERTFLAPRQVLKAMAPTCVVVRLPNAGTLLGDAMARHEDARVTSVPMSWTSGPDGSWMEVLALVEGLSDDDLAALLLAWNRRYGRPAQVIGEAFALRLPVRLDAVRAPGIADVMRLSSDLPVLGSVAEDGWAEQWFRCADAREAEEVAGRLRRVLRGVPGAEVRVAAPRQRDLSCWEVLHFASGVSAPLEA